MKNGLASGLVKNPMDKEQFEKLPTEHRFNIIKTHIDLFSSAVSSRMQLLTTVCALCATLLVVATFNEKLIPLSDLVRVLLSILLGIIPPSLFLYNRDLKGAQAKHKASIELFLGEHPKKGETFLNWLTAIFPDFAICAVSVVIFILIVIILRF